MTEFDINSNTTYNTAINIIGGLRDASVLFKAIDAHFNPADSLNELVKDRDAFNLRTERSRDRVERAVRKEFLNFKSPDHEVLIQKIFQEHVPLRDKELVLLWQFALNNHLFREVTANVFVKLYYSGRASISKDDIIAYMKEYIVQDKNHGIDWSEKTINTLSTKYLNLMSKLNFIHSGRMKSFQHIRPSTQSQVVFLYFAKLYSPDVVNILANEFLPLSFIPKEDLRERLKKHSLKGWLNVYDNGVALNIELTHNYKEVCDALYQ